MTFGGGLCACAQDIDLDLVRANKMARAKCNDVLGSQQGEDGEAMLSAISGKRAMLTSIDPIVALELDWLAAQPAESGVERLQAQVLACLPEKGPDFDKATWTFERAVGQLQRVQGSALFRMGSKASQALVLSAKEVLQSLQQGRRPAVDGSHSDFMATLLTRTTLFATLEVEGSKGKRLLRGKDAILGMLRQCSAQHEKAGCCDLGELEELGRWLFVLDAAQRQTYDGMLAAAIAKATTEGGSAKGSSNGAGVKRKAVAEEKSEKRKQIAEQQLDKDIDELFGKSVAM